MPDYRAHFDFDIRFANDGGMQGQGFRLDLPTPDVDADAVGLLLPASGARFTAAPPAVEGLGTFPVRAFATLP